MSRQPRSRACGAERNERSTPGGLCLCGFAWMALLGAGCLADRDVFISRMAVQVPGESGEGALEVEVHLFDIDEGLFLGCAGKDSGLEQVDAPGIGYSVSARFLKSEHVQDPESPQDQWISEIDVLQRNLVFVVSEDDQSACATLYEAPDDIVGISRVVAGASLESPLTLSFDRVVELTVRIGAP